MGDVVNLFDAAARKRHPSDRDFIPDIGEHTTEMLGVARWLIDAGYPEDWTTEDDPPDALWAAVVHITALDQGIPYDEAQRGLRARQATADTD